MNYPSMFLAGFSLVLSFITIYFTFLRPARLKIFVGPYIIISRQDHYYAFTVPTTIANQSNQTGLIKRCTMALSRIDKPQQNYHMLWHSFRKIDADGAFWIQTGIVSSIAVIGLSTESRNIEYQWKADSSPELIIKEGTYQLQFYFWAKKSKPVAVLQHEIFINSNQENHFRDPQKIGKILQFPIDHEQNMNELLTQSQVGKLNS